jgi:hypothetical protein
MTFLGFCTAKKPRAVFWHRSAPDRRCRHLPRSSHIALTNANLHNSFVGRRSGGRIDTNSLQWSHSRSFIVLGVAGWR